MGGVCCTIQLPSMICLSTKGKVPQLELGNSFSVVGKESDAVALLAMVDATFLSKVDKWVRLLFSLYKALLAV